MNNLVSIAMCSYNGERFIQEQIDSILSQSYTNFELIIVDDGSNDNTIKILEDYVKKDNRVKFFQNDKNLGFVKNFEKAISLCNGDYIALADQDDIWKKDKIEVFIKNIGDNLLIYSDAILIDQYSKEIGKELIRPNGNLVEGKCNKAFIFYNCVSGNTLMFKKELIKYILPIPEKITFHDIWIAFIASTIGTITFTEEAMTYYRRYSEQVTKDSKKEYKTISDRLKKKEKSYLLHAENLVNYCKEFAKVKNIDEDMKNILDIFIGHYSNYNKGYFNLKMRDYLKKYKNELFAIKREKTRDRYIKRYYFKNKLLKIFFYSI
ncbi:glycosyltransferase, family 2 [Aliarcobacter faecis]|uniref:glycosyltransferase family 2 protein n=1 Tax=Aliarcobacter faecis TaxID=1564138 RepID=UPI0004AE0352|nr:glycosyltransferase family 2 protein [Aliarcobacter faecis]QKF72664.1 glycosyltransferase, family 2 [Aliarcobacter faecis]